jgi:hypothetical protein
VPPHRVAFMRIARLLEQALFREYNRIVAENALLYGGNFASTNSDFYTNKERRESYGCLVANMLAQQYVFEVRLPCSFCLTYSRLTYCPCFYSIGWKAIIRKQTFV